MSIKAFESTLEYSFNELMTLEHDNLLSSYEGYDFLITKIIQMGKQIFETLPTSLNNMIVECVFNSLKKLDKGGCRTLFLDSHHVDDIDWLNTFPFKKKTIVLFSAILLQPQVKTLDLRLCPYPIKKVLLEYLYKMSGLEVLIINGYLCDNSETRDYNCKIFGIDDKLFKGLACMPSLLEFHFEDYCNDEIIKCISKNCKQLEVLNVPNSYISKDSVPYITQLKHLKYIDFYKSKIKIKHYTTFLCELPMLENIGYGEVLQHMNEVFENCISHMSKTPLNIQNKWVLNLKKLVLHCTELESIPKMIIDLCPAVVTLELIETNNVDISSLGQLENLKSLFLYTGHIEKIKLLPYLERYHTLEQLHLEDIHSIDTLFLMNISDNCPNLKTFNIKFSSFNIFKTNNSFLKNKKYFTQLESFVCECFCQIKFLDIILSCCYGIKILHLGKRVLINDNDVERIISNNPMTELNELKIFISSHLSMKSVYFLIENCPSLKVIRKLKAFRKRISKSELGKLKRYIKENNLDLTLK